MSHFTCYMRMDGHIRKHLLKFIYFVFLCFIFTQNFHYFPRLAGFLSFFGVIKRYHLDDIMVGDIDDIDQPQYHKCK